MNGGGKVTMSKTMSCIGLLALTLLSGCASSPKSHFYTLHPAYSGAPVSNHEGCQIGVGPFAMPTYLDRPQVVIRGSGNEMIVNEFARWTEPIEYRFLNVLARNLVAATGESIVLEHPWRGEFEPQHRAQGRVDRFEADTGGVVTLEVRWGITSGEDNAIRRTEHSTYVENADPEDMGEIAAAMSRTLASFARDIATAMMRDAGECN